MKMKDFFKEKGYVMVSRALLMRVFERQGGAEGDEEAFLRILVYANYKPSEVYFGCGRKVVCQRGDSAKSFLSWGQILGWGRTRVRRFFKVCFRDGIIVQVPDGCSSHIRIPDYDAWTDYSKTSMSGEVLSVNVPTDRSGSALPSSLENLSGIPVEASVAPSPPPSGPFPSVPSSPGSQELIDLDHFMIHYSEVTQTPLLNIGRAQRYWNQLTADERQQAYDHVEDYYFNLSDIRYCMQAATYLRDKAYLNRYDY